MNQSPDAYSILSPSKKLSQLIAKSWLDGNRIPLDDKKFLIENNILSEQEANFFEKITVDEVFEKPPYEGSIDAIAKAIYLKYPQRPDGITDEALKDWIDSPSDSPPWIPDDEELKFTIPIVSTFIGEE